MAKKTVSEKLGLERLNEATPAACIKRAKELERMLEKNKVPKNLIKAVTRMAAIYRVKALKNAKKPAKVVVSKKATRIKKHTKVDPAQLTLPNFDLAFAHEAFQKRLSARIDELVDQAVANLIEGAKGKVG